MKPKIYSKEDILRAMRHTKSVRAAARYLGCSYQHLKKYIRIYEDEESGKTLFELHKNQAGKGIPKQLKGGPNQPTLESLLNGEVDIASFTPDKIKQRLIFESYLPEECNKCKMHERRVTDYKIPLLLNFIDGNKRNYKLENLELICYNCFFLYITDPFTPDQINYIEDFVVDKFKVEKPNWDLDDSQLENMRSLGLDF